MKNNTEKFTTDPFLGFADSKLQNTLHIDAGTTGLGASLYQEQEGQMRAIAHLILVEACL